MKKTIYLDNNATTPLHPEVKKAVIQAMELYGNPSSLHKPGREARKAIEKARAEIAKFIGAQSEELMFTGSGSEANNTVINSVYCHKLECKNKKCPLNKHKIHIITSAIEHPATLESVQCFKRRGFKLTYVPVDAKGIVKVEEVKKAITSETGLISIMLANNETGTVQPIKEIAKIAKKQDIYMHTDAVQALGKIPVNVQDLNVDFLTISGHKIYAPKGIGALYIRKGLNVCPLIYGGHQEKGRRAGTENTIGIVAFGKAVEMLEKEMKDNNERIRELRNKLRKGITDRIKDVVINGNQENIVPNTLNVSFKYIEGESILLKLDFEGICVSTGSACSSGSLDPSQVIMALGVPAEQAHGSIRFSLGRETTEQDIDYVLEKLPGIVQELREMSPLKN